MNFTVKKPYFFKALPLALMTTVLAAGIASCNKKDDEPEEEKETISYLPNTAVTSFKLKADKNIMARLDSVFFSIDLDHGVIYNADSLPVGTKVDKLVASISYSSAITSAKIIMSGGTTRNDTIDYINNPGDSIDFTGNVRLILATDNEEMKKEYTVKLNVHRQNPDSLVWNEVAVVSLPSRLPDPVDQKSVEKDGAVYSLIMENDGSYTLASCGELYGNEWEKIQISPSFTPDVGSFAASSSAFYILDSNGVLYTSPDATAWTATGETWNRIIGGFADTAVGILTDSEGLKYAQYPMKDLQAVAVDPAFPVDGFSNLASYSNKWAASPVALFCGGVMADGSLSSDVWAFDGSKWIVLASGAFPAVKGASLIPYHAFRYTNSTSMQPTELNAWLLLGGEMADGAFTRTVYISYDNGVNWRVGDSLLQLPDFFPLMTGCDNVVQVHTEDSSLSAAWRVMGRSDRHRVKWSVDGDILYWECPYIYLIGGNDSSDRLCNTIWRGALNRLQSAPII